MEDLLKHIEIMVSIMAKETLNANEAAALIGISTNRLYHLVHDNDIPHYKNGTKTMFKKSEIEKWMLGKKVLCDSEIESMLTKARPEAVRGRKKIK